MAAYFTDRKEAGEVLAQELIAYKGAQGAIVLALPRGGVPVAFEVARALRLPLDLMLVRKLGVPGQEELAMGAIAIGDVQVLNQPVMEAIGISKEAVDRVVAAERKELARRNAVYRNNQPAPDLKGKTVILVDDGMATGANMHAAVLAARKQQPARIVVAVPAASEEAVSGLRHEADQVVCPYVPTHFYSLGRAYIHFEQMSDGEVTALLDKAGHFKEQPYHASERA